MFTAQQHQMHLTPETNKKMMVMVRGLMSQTQPPSTGLRHPLEEGAGKRCSEEGLEFDCTVAYTHSRCYLGRHSRYHDHAQQSEWLETARLTCTVQCVRTQCREVVRERRRCACELLRYVLPGPWPGKEEEEEARFLSCLTLV